MLSTKKNLLSPKQKKHLKQNLTGYAFVLPQVLGVFVLIVLGIIFVVGISFTNWNFYNGFSFEKTKWMGLQNYLYIFNNANFRHALVTNGFFLLMVPVTTFLALMLGSFINNKFFFERGLRAIYFLPNICNIVAIVMLWSALFHPRLSPVSSFLLKLSIDPPMWFGTPWNARVLIYLLWLWKGLGYYAFVYLGALNSVPTHLYESARLDGAGKIVQFFKITVPMVSSTTFFLLITGFMSAIKEWSYIMLLTNGNPGGTTSVVGMLAYQNAFPSSGYTQDLGVASSITVVMLAFAVIISLANWKLQDRWVYYE